MSFLTSTLTLLLSTLHTQPEGSHENLSQMLSFLCSEPTMAPTNSEQKPKSSPWSTKSCMDCPHYLSALSSFFFPHLSLCSNHTDPSLFLDHSRQAPSLIPLHLLLPLPGLLFSRGKGTPQLILLLFPAFPHCPLLAEVSLIPPAKVHTTLDTSMPCTA